jgi:hypothetical protein
VTHQCDQVRSDCMSIPPCVFADDRTPCKSCNRTFRSQTCFDRHKTRQAKRKDRLRTEEKLSDVRFVSLT